QPSTTLFPYTTLFRSSRIKLRYTRAMISAALGGVLSEADFSIHNIFGFRFPNSCPRVPKEILDPRATWKDKQAYEQTVRKVAERSEEHTSELQSREKL